ncbi:MAG: LTA synthase family protein, partial [Bacilli bacterium]|nr:LTA synthase family protein [Bacilli bacterium]
MNNVELSIKKFGVIHGLFIDLWRSVWGFAEEINLETPIINIVGGNENQPTIEYDYNNLDIDFASLIANESDEIVREMHEYFQNEVGTKQNQFTDFFKGKNLILFMAESFNEIAVDEKRTPTLYKLVHNGFVFNQFYSPTISSTIGGEFQELMGMVAESGFLKPWKSGENSYPFGIATSFKNEGFATYAYHNHNYTFQNRNKYLKAIGFDNFTGCRNGLEKKINCLQWPESDLEMIEATVDDYIYSDTPFFTYYVTVSGHGDYGWASTAMGRKHKEEVLNLPHSEKVLSYLAANMELDRALETLLKKLEDAGKLDDTVIALVGDHYPYFLSVDEVNEISSYKKDSVVEINHSNFILWNNKMEKVEVNKLGSQIDVLPTLYNLFGIPYDSRLIIGKDILSTEPGLAIFGNRSWVSDYGTYFSSSGEFILKEGKTVADDYVTRMNKLVANKMNMSKLIMEKDYY